MESADGTKVVLLNNNMAAEVCSQCPLLLRVHVHMYLNVDDAGMTRKVVSSPHSRLFYYDRTQLIEIVQIEVTSQ